MPVISAFERSSYLKVKSSPGYIRFYVTHTHKHTNTHTQSLPLVQCWQINFLPVWSLLIQKRASGVSQVLLRGLQINKASVECKWCHNLIISCPLLLIFFLTKFVSFLIILYLVGRTEEAYITVFPLDPLRFFTEKLYSIISGNADLNLSKIFHFYW